jgi:hypothetical protein
MAGVNFSQVMEKKMNKIFSVLLLVTFSFGFISCSNSEDSSGTTSQLGQVLDQPNSSDDRNSIDLPVITLDSCYLIDNSTIDNSTVDKSSISDNSSIKDSTVINCSTVTRSIVDNSSSIENSQISYSIINNSSINNSSICVQSTIDNSTIENSTVCNNATVQGGSTVRNSSSVCNTTIDNATIDNSTVNMSGSICNDNVSFSIIDKTILNQNVTEQRPPTVDNVSITSTTEADYDVMNTEDNVSVTAFFDETVFVDNANGTPKIIIVVGSDNQTATYASGNGTSQLVFQYTIQSGDNDTDGISIKANYFELNSGTIRDGSGNDATITHSLADNNTDYKVDNTNPKLHDNVSFTSSTSPTNISQYKIPANGDTCDGSEEGEECYVYATATFTENVTVTGIPELSITIGDSPGTIKPRKATYASGNLTLSLVFGYAIRIDDPLDDDGILIGEDAIICHIDNCTIKDLAGNPATITHGDVDELDAWEVKNWL